MPIAAFQLATVRGPKDRKGRDSSKVLDWANHCRLLVTSRTI
jgi:hypothetical protein